jgi:hypothetical protein
VLHRGAYSWKWLKQAEIPLYHFAIRWFSPGAYIGYLFWIDPATMLIDDKS